MLVLVSSTRVTVDVDVKVTVLSVLVEAALPLPAASWAIPAGIVAITVPSVMPLTATVYVVGPPVTVTVLVPPAVPAIVTSALVKSLTALLRTAVTLIGAVLVGSGWPAAWLIVTARPAVSKVTLLSVLVDAVLPLPAASWATPAAIAAT